MLNCPKEMLQNSSHIVAADDSKTAGRNGLVCQYQFEDGSSQFIFLHISKENGPFGIDHSLGFSTENYVQVISSCNGLLLLSSIGDHGLKFHVFNPMSKDFLTLPQPAITCRQIIRSGLAFDGDHHYQVILVHVAHTDTEVFPGGLEMEIFSSKTGKWRRNHPTNPLSSIPAPEFEFSELKTPPLYSKGAIHWEISGHLLVYQVDKDHCELIELPNLLEDWAWQSTMTYRRCLWESNGRVHYTYTDFDGVQTWVLLNEHDHDYYSFYSIYDLEKFRWALANSVNHQELSMKHQEIYFRFGQWEPYDVSALAFCEDSETMYLQLPGFVLSYNTQTKDVEEVCTYKFPGVNFNCCTFLHFVYGSPFHPETAKEISEVGAVDLPIKDKLVNFVF